MRQTPILIVLVAVAGLAIFLIGKVSNRAVSLNGSDELAMPDDEGAVAGEPAGGWSDRGRSPSEGGSEKGVAPGSPAFKQRRVARGPAAPGAPLGHERGSSLVVGGGGARGKGQVGTSVSRGIASAGGSRVSVAGGRVDPDVAPGSSRRSEVVDFLAEQAPPGDAAENPDDPTGEGNEEVVLSVPLNREFGTIAEDATAPVIEQDLQLADDGVGVKFDKDSVLAFPNAGNITGDSGSITFEFVPEWEGGEVGDYSFVNVRNPNDPANLLRIYKNGRYLRFLFADSSGRERNVGFDMMGWEPGEPHRVTATWGDNETRMYVDNRLAGRNTYNDPFEIRPGTPMYVGSDVPQAPPTGAGATISNIQVFGRALGQDEVSSLPIGGR